MKYHLFCAIVLFMGSAAQAQPVWKPDMFCVRFSVHSLTGDIPGTIRGLEGKLMIDSAQLDKSWLKARVDVGTINTGNRVRDSHLGRPDYFDAMSCPYITIASVSIRKNRADSYTATCDLTLKGTTRRIDLPFTFTRTGSRCEFAGAFTLNRLDYNVGKPSMLLANRVTIWLTIDGQVTDDRARPSDVAVR